LAKAFAAPETCSGSPVPARDRPGLPASTQYRSGRAAHSPWPTPFAAPPTGIRGRLRAAETSPAQAPRRPAAAEAPYLLQALAP